MRSDDSDPRVRQEVAEIMRAVMVENALHHRADDPYRSIDPFSAAVLQGHGLLTVTEDARQRSDILGILVAPDAPSRQPAPAGPYVFVKEGDGGTVINPADMLSDPVPDLRLAALRHFAGLPEGTLASRSRRQIEEAGPRVASDDRTEWFPAAKGVYDLLRSDVYLTLAGFAQCYAMGYMKGVNQFLPRLLRPDAAILSSIDLACWNPSEDYDPALAVVHQLAAARSLPEALAGYYRQLGHLPLCGPAGLGGLLREWADDHPGQNCWDPVWAWADEEQSPVARYHACVAFLSNPKLVPQGADEFLWNEVGDAVNDYRDDAARTRWVEAWAARDELAVHYGNYLECLLPGLPGERLMLIAWWLTERICEQQPPSPGLLRRIRETTFAGELQRSTFMNHLTHPPVGQSSLRYMTRLVRRVWSASVLCELGEAQWLFGQSPPTPEVGHGIDTALASLLVLGYPRPLTAAARPVYAFERALGPVVTAWARATGSGHQTAEQVDPAEVLRRTDEVATPLALPELVASLADESPENDLRAAHRLRQMAYFDPAVGESLWREFNQGELWRAVLTKTAPAALEVLFEALSELQVLDVGAWRGGLAHMCALAAGEAAPDRRQLLFGVTLFASIHAGGVSALDRLMHGPHRGEFAAFAAKWRDQLVPALRALTPWAAGRVRAVLPSLTLDELD